jgi:transketolase
MRNRFADTFYQLGKKDRNLCIIVADISPAGSISKFRSEFPERFINTGVAEQIMIGMAAGMAQRGLRPFVYTIASFALYRPFEFIRDDISYQDLPVTIVGIGGGVSYSTLGATHHAMEDIAVASTIPNMIILAPVDPLEVEAATKWCAVQNLGPVYLRLGKAGEPILTDSISESWEFGKIRSLMQGEKVCILTYGPITKLAIEAREEISKKFNTAPSIYIASTIQPLDLEGLDALLNIYTEIIVLEEHIYYGGLAMRVNEYVKNTSRTNSISSVALEHRFSHTYGTHTDVLSSLGLSLDILIEAIEKALKKPNLN